MKNKLKVSTVSIICALCASGMSGAYAASSVRSLGGTGTYTSAASASQSGSGAGVARAGSVRVTPTTTTKATTVKPTSGASTTGGRAATTSRLSLGKYLGGKTAISGGASTRPNGTGTSGGTSSTDPGLSAELNNRVNVLEDTVADLKSSSEDLSETKQDKLTGDDYIEIDSKGNVSLLVDNLKADLTGIDGVDGREVVIGTSNDDKYIVWQYDGDASWNNLIAISDLVGPQGEKGEKGDPGDAANLELYSTTAEMNAAIADAVNGFVTAKTLGEALAEFPTNDDLTEKLATYATKEDLAGVESGAGTALTETLKNYATNDSLNNVERTTNLTQTISGADTASAEKYTSERAVATALSTKADVTDLTALSAQLESKADVDDIYTKTEVDEKIVPAVSSSFETKMTELTTTVENNMKELETELAATTTTINNITNEQGQVVNIAPNTITSVEIAPNTITNVELADGSVTNAKLGIKAEGDAPDGMYVLLVTPTGEQIWADLAMAGDAPDTTQGVASN